MSTLETQYKNYLKENPEPAFTFEEWSDWKFSNMELPPPHNGLRPIDEHAEELSDWDVTLMDGLENEPYVSDDFQIGPDGAYEHIEYSIPIYENGIKTEYTVDGIIGDEKYYQLLELGNGKDLPDMINTTIKQTMNKEQIIDEAYENYREKNHILYKDTAWTKEEFINKIKTNPEFSEKWGLKIYTKVDGDKVWMGMVYNDNAVEIRLK